MCPHWVAGYARRAGAEPDKPWRTASFTQTGEMRLKRGAPFVPLKAWEIVALGAPGMVWDGRIAGGGMRNLRVVDALVEGQGLLEARIFGSIRVARKEGDATTLAEAFPLSGGIALDAGCDAGQPGDPLGRGRAAHGRGGAGHGRGPRGRCGSPSTRVATSLA